MKTPVVMKCPWCNQDIIIEKIKQKELMSILHKAGEFKISEFSTKKLFNGVCF